MEQQSTKVKFIARVKELKEDSGIEYRLHIADLSNISAELSISSNNYRHWLKNEGWVPLYSEFWSFFHSPA